MDFERLVGSQLLSLLPMFGGILQNLTGGSDGQKNGKKRAADNDYNFFKESKILKNLLEEGLKKYSVKTQPSDTEDDVHDESLDSNN